MDLKIVQAYANGRIAGSRYSRDKQLDHSAQRPTNPNPPTEYLASVEWERGFTEGFERSEKLASLPLSANDGGAERRSA